MAALFSSCFVSSFRCAETQVGKLLEGEVEELPDLSDAEKVMEKYRLDDDAKSKLREIIEKRAEDKDEVLVKIKKHLDNCANPSSMICSLPDNTTGACITCGVADHVGNGYKATTTESAVEKKSFVEPCHGIVDSGIFNRI